MTPKEISDKFEELIRTGQMKWEKPDRTTLEPATCWYLDIFDQAKLTYLVGSIRINKALVISINSDTLPYFEHHPEKRIHQWPDYKYEEGFDNNEAFVYLMRCCYPNIDEQKLMKLYEIIDLDDAFDPDKFKTDKDPWEEGYEQPKLNYEFLYEKENDKDHIDGEEWKNDQPPASEFP